MKFLIVISACVSIISASAVIYVYKSEPKMAYVRLGYLYENFAYKNELESKLSNVVQSRKSILDSLGAHLKALANTLQNSKKQDETKIQEFEEEKQQYLAKKKQFDQDNDEVTTRYRDQINKQINQYLKDYGTANGYSYIFGAEGSGSIMSADDKYDISATVLQYINERYKGKS